MLGLQGLLESRRFWLVMLDAGVSVAFLLAARFLSPGDVELVKQIIAIIQPILVTLIIGLTIENVQNIRVDGAIQVAELAKPTSPKK